MRTSLWAIVVMLGASSMSPAQTPAEIVERAVKAHGGDALAKMKYVSHSSKGKVNLGGVDLVATRSARWALPDRAHWELELSRDGAKIKTRIAIVGLAGWQQVNANPAADLTPMAYDTMAEEAWLFWLSSVLPLKGKGLTLSPAEPATVNGDLASGVLVSRSGKPDVTLWFAKNSGLLVKARFKGTDGGQPTSKEFVFSGHQDFAGVKLPTRLVDFANNVRMGDWQITDWSFTEKLNPEDFAKPK